MRLRSQTLAGATLLVVGLGGLRFAFSLAAKLIAASKFGMTSGNIDPFVAAMRLPQIVGDFLIGGSFYFAVIPCLHEARRRFGDRFSWQLARSVLLRTTLLLAFVSVFYGLFPAPALRLIAPNLDGWQRTVSLRICPVVSPLFLLMGLVLVEAGVIHSYRHFWLVGVGSLLPPVGTMLLLWLYGDSMGVAAWAWGLMIGTLLQAVLLLGVLFHADRGAHRRDGDESAACPEPSGEGAVEARAAFSRSMWQLALAITLAVLIGRVNMVVQSRLASNVPGGLTILEYSWGIVMLAFGLSVAPLGATLYPLLSEYAATEQNSLLAKTASVGMRVASFILAPIVVGLVAHSKDLVVVALQRGKFTAVDTSALSCVMALHAVGLIVLVFMDIVSKLLFGTRGVRSFLLFAVVHAVVAWPLNMLMFSAWQVPGLAVATALVNGCTLTAGLILLARRGLYILTRSDLTAYVRMLSLGALAYCLDHVCMRALFADDSQSLVRLLVGAGIIVVVYLGGSTLARAQELSLIAGRIARLRG